MVWKKQLNYAKDNFLQMLNLAKFKWVLQIHKVLDYKTAGEIYSLVYFLLYQVSLHSLILIIFSICWIRSVKAGKSLHRAVAHEELVKFFVIWVEMLLMQTPDYRWFYESQLPNRDGNEQPCSTKLHLSQLLSPQEAISLRFEVILSPGLQTGDSKERVKPFQKQVCASHSLTVTGVTSRNTAVTQTVPSVWDPSWHVLNSRRIETVHCDK